jgi:hypothetical protein
MIGFHNSDLDFNICTGRNPDKNIGESFKYFDLHSVNKTLHHYSFGDLVAKDPLGVIAGLFALIQIILTMYSWIYSVCIVLPRSSNNIANNNSRRLVPLSINSRFEETKNVIIGAGGTLVGVFVAIVLIFPTLKSKSIANKNMEDINFGYGRLWIYISRISIPIVAYCLFPTVIIANNAKMRATLKRQLTDLFH